jgi:hypothetical protein
VKRGDAKVKRSSKVGCIMPLENGAAAGADGPGLGEGREKEEEGRDPGTW